MDQKNAKLKICVVGAGVNGLCACRHLLQNGFRKITIFEASSRIGGLWRYESDPYYPNALYQNLKTNLHRSVMFFPDLYFEDECKDNNPHHTFILRYVQYYAEHFDLNKYIMFNCKVVKIVPPDASHDHNDDGHSLFPPWTVTHVDETDQLQTQQQQFDAVIICNGHFMCHYIPEFVGFKSTKIAWFHSREYREPDPLLYADKLIVIIGGGYSGNDIGRDISSNCRNVSIYQVMHAKYRLPSRMGYVYKSFVKRFTEHSIEFDDGVIIFPDLVILCTGYMHDYPFLKHSQFLQHEFINVEHGFSCNGRAVNGLFKHLVYPHLPTIFFPGINHGVVPFPHAYYQSKWMAKILTDLTVSRTNTGWSWKSQYIPDKRDMIDWAKQNKQFSGKRKQHFLPNQTPYFKYICKQIGEEFVL